MTMGGIRQAGRTESWPRQLMAKWLNFKHTRHEFHHDCESNGAIGLEGKQGIISSCFTEFMENLLVKLPRGQSETSLQQLVDKHELRVSVGTWNVGGKPPPDDLDLQDWLDTCEPADIYVFGFQEIVPLNAGNVIGVEDEGPAAKWESLIRETLNSKMGNCKETEQPKSFSAPGSPVHDNENKMNNVPEVSHVGKLLGRIVSGKSYGPLETSSFLGSQGNLHYSVDKPVEGKTDFSCNVWEMTDSGDETSWSSTEQASETTDWINEQAKLDEAESQVSKLLDSRFSSTGTTCSSSKAKFSRVASKQMVGIFITIWVRSRLLQHVHNVKVSSIGVGIMGYIGNKGSISISMSLHHTSFCFVCAHLTAGHKEGDELHRNADIAEILRRTTFQRLVKLSGLELPETILAHDRVIWLGDLNYRVAMRDEVIWKAVKLQDWQTLQSKDELKLEQVEGRVLKDWHEGSILFPPTYKFLPDSDQYCGEALKSREKCRTPAWCDRILWYGTGLRQLKYTCGKAKLSDHRSVTATFMAEVEMISQRKLKKACTFTKNAKVEVEELMPRITPIVDVCVTFVAAGSDLIDHSMVDKRPSRSHKLSRTTSHEFHKAFSSNLHATNGLNTRDDSCKGRAVHVMQQGGFLSVQ
ncbi:unnamed protein product [Sphagnum jensenii]|uniref:Inositol polyphosphate-related phosphatase domain-containing protein n=1 Tax=Sphagnum jensenii TaxID=128206 RepID=A0ABP1B8E9_9BRYO